MEIKLSVDRIEGDIAICYDGDKKYELPAHRLYEGLIVSATIDGNGNLLSLTPLYKETKKQKQALFERTRALFNRSKK